MNSWRKLNRIPLTCKQCTLNLGSLWVETFTIDFHNDRLDRGRRESQKSERKSFDIVTCIYIVFFFFLLISTVPWKLVLYSSSVSLYFSFLCVGSNSRLSMQPLLSWRLHYEDKTLRLPSSWVLKLKHFILEWSEDVAWDQSFRESPSWHIVRM